MLIAIVLSLVSQQTVTLPANLGRSNFAMTLERLAQVDAVLARELHEQSTVKPITCSGLIGVQALDQHTIRRGEVVRVRVTGLTEPVATALHAALIADRPQEWSLLRRSFAVVDATCDERRDAWAGLTSYERLVTEEVSSMTAPEPVIRMEFMAPVAFRSGEMTVPLPLPGLVFGSLLDRWNAFSEIALEPELREIAHATVGVSQFHLDSAPVAQKQKGLEIGCLGEITYSYLERQPFWLHQLRILAAFALYGGVGLKTTMGMGQTRWRR